MTKFNSLRIATPIVSDRKGIVRGFARHYQEEVSIDAFVNLVRAQRFVPEEHSGALRRRHVAWRPRDRRDPHRSNKLRCESLRLQNLLRVCGHSRCG